MTVVFDSIVKNENSLPVGPEIIRGVFPGAPPIAVMARSEPIGDPAGTERDPSNQRKAEGGDGQSCFAVK